MVADRWFRLQNIEDGISLITEIHVARWLRCNIWHIRGRNHDLLIDSGMGLGSLKQEIVQLAERPVKCISTHCHFDHMGGAHEFECRLGHRLERSVYTEPTRYNTSMESFVRAETFEALPYAGFRHEEYVVRPAPLTGYLDEGDVVDLGDRVFQVLHLPGHSPGSIALWENRSGILFSGDAIYDGDLYDSAYHSDTGDYRDSLSRLRELPVKRIHAGHYESFDFARMTEIIDQYLAGGDSIGDVDGWIRSHLD